MTAAGGASGEGQSAAELAIELQRFARYLIGATATPYQIENYIRFHRRHPLAAKSAFDGLLYRMARKGGVGLALADAYSGLLARTGLLRAKLVATLAILEVSPPSFRVLDAPSPRGKAAWIGSGFRGAMAAAAFICAAAVLVPAHILTGRRR